MCKKLFKRWFLLFILLCKQTINRIKGNRLTYKGERLRDYLIKVIAENYTPQTMVDYEDEKAFNPEELKDEARMQKASEYLITLMEYP